MAREVIGTFWLLLMLAGRWHVFGTVSGSICWNEMSSSSKDWLVVPSFQEVLSSGIWYLAMALRRFQTDRNLGPDLICLLVFTKYCS